MRQKLGQFYSNISFFGVGFESFYLLFLSEGEEEDDEGAEMDTANSSAPVMSENEDDDSQMSKKDVSLSL